MRNVKKIATFIIGCMALLLIGSNFSYWHGEIEHTNRLKADTMDAEIVEVFQQGSAPKGTVMKKVSFQNNSSSAAFLRVAYAETWQCVNNGESQLLNNQMNGNEIAKKNWSKSWIEDDLWQDGGDGWVYYKKILLPGTKTESVLESITFPEYEGVYQAYEAAEYQLYFRMELLQASDSQATLNRSKVNEKASKEVFGKTAVVSGEDVLWK